MIAKYFQVYDTKDFSNVFCKLLINFCYVRMNNILYVAQSMSKLIDFLLEAPVQLLYCTVQYI
jgi:hypothetical protein